MKMTIQYNRDSAVKSDFGGFITETGIYVAQILQAESFASKGGAQGVRFYVRTKESESAFVDLFIYKNDGSELLGHDILQSIMMILGIQTLNVYPAKCRDRYGEVVDGYRIKELEQKWIGLALQKEFRKYETEEGEIKEKFDMRLVRAFDPKTGRTASEIEKNSEPKIIARLKDTLKDKPANEITPSAKPVTTQKQNPMNSVADDDIPF